MPYCSTCGTLYAADARFCSGCGRAIGAKTTSGAQDVLVPGYILNGRYHIESMLGQGGFGITYLSFDNLLKVNRVVKEYFPDGATRSGECAVTPPHSLAATHQDLTAKFLEEARTIASLDHPNVIRVMDCFFTNNTAYYVTEYNRGRSLGKLLAERKKPFVYGEIRQWLEEIIDALSYLHGENIIHQDIKPDNIIITDKGRVVLIDFGSARAYAAGKTQKYSVYITPGYAPLEQQAVKAKRGPYTDIYSLGATLYELLTGQTPEEAALRHLDSSVFTRPAALIPSIPAAVDEAIVWALALRPEDRPQDMAALLGKLRGVGEVSATPFCYQNFREARDYLAAMLGRVSKLAAELGMSEREEYLSRLMEKVAAAILKVMVVGEFKRGKSTIINALLGQDILPAYATPSTAVITELKWGADKRSMLHFQKSATPSDTLAKPVLVHLRRFQGKAVPPLEVPFDSLDEYTIPIADLECRDIRAAVEKLELFWPLDFCHEGVELIDSPGMVAYPSGNKATFDYLAQTDVVLFVMSCLNTFSLSERDVIEHIHALGHQNIFFILNYNDQISPKDRERLKAYVEKLLEVQTALGRKGIFFLSAFVALEGRENRDDVQVAESGILELEKSLKEYLSSRGRFKLLQPAQELLRVLDEMLQIASSRKRLPLDNSGEINELRFQAAELVRCLADPSM